MSILFLMAAAATALTIEERLEQLIARLRAPRFQRARRYRFN